MPLPIELAHRLTRRLAEARKTGILPWLRPDGKSQVTVEYAHGRPRRVETVLISTQHSPDVDMETVHQGVLEQVIHPVIPESLRDDKLNVFVNPTGRFVIGGPLGGPRLTGRTATAAPR